MTPLIHAWRAIVADGRTGANRNDAPPSLFQITRCAQNRLPREKPAPVPNSESAAIALRSPYCSANAPRTPQRTPRPHNLPHTRPIRSPIPRKKRHFPAPPVPGPAPSNPTHALPILTTAPFLPTNPPQFRNFANPLETPAHPCYPRPSEGPTPRPGKPYPPHGVRPQASVRASLVGTLWQCRYG